MLLFILSHSLRSQKASWAYFCTCECQGKGLGWGGWGDALTEVKWVAIKNLINEYPRPNPPTPCELGNLGNLSTLDKNLISPTLDKNLKNLIYPTLDKNLKNLIHPHSPDSPDCLQGKGLGFCFPKIKNPTKQKNMPSPPKNPLLFPQIPKKKALTQQGRALLSL